MKRRWILWLLVAGFIWIIITRFTEIEKLTATLASGQWQWVLAAVILEVLYYLVFPATYLAAFNTVEIQSDLFHLVPITLGSQFVNVVAPTGGAGGAALFIDDASQRGYSPARATTATLLQLAADFGSFALILVVGLAYLSTHHDLKIYEIIAALLLLGIFLSLNGMISLGVWKPGTLEKLLNWLERIVNAIGKRFGRDVLLPEGWSEHNTNEFSSAAEAIIKHPDRLALTFGLAFLSHLLELVVLNLLFLAFGQPVGLGVLVSGYAMAVLFWIVSITPQGIGVVEGVMILVFTSLGVPGEVATAVSLGFRALAFWLPFLLGFILLRRVNNFGASNLTLAEIFGVHAVATLTVVMGFINLLSSVTPSLMSRVQLLEGISPLQVRRGGHLTAALAGFALILLANGLWRRKRVAWLVTLVVLLISIISHLLKGLDYEEALLAAALATWLLSLRSEFHARSDPPSIRQGILAVLAALTFTLAYGAAGFYLLDHHFQINFGLEAALRQTIIMFTQFYDPGLEPITGFGRYFAASIYFVGSVTFGYALLLLIRPVLIRRPATGEERRRAQSIVESFGHSSLARLTLLPDKSYHFTEGGSMIAFTLKGRVALSLGDPIGPPEDLAGAIESFCHLCRRNDWQPAFYQAQPETLAAYQEAGFDTLCIGQEAIVDLVGFSLEGRANKGLRSANNHLKKLGYSARVILPPLEVELLQQLRQISDEWLAHMRGSEKRFSVGWFEEEYIRCGPVIIVEAPDRMITAFANIIPEYQLNEISIDLMRHRGRVESGTMDYLFVSLFEWARDQGYKTFDLGLSPLYGIGERSQDPAIEKTLRYIYEHVNRFYNFKGLHEFKEKFHPNWSARYLIFPGAASLPAVALALVGVDSGDGLLSYLKH